MTSASSTSSSPRATQVGLAYALFCYVAFLASFAYFVAFLNGLWVPKGIDDGPSMSVAAALVIDLGLVVLWGLQHSVMARPAFKRLWTQVIPPHTERATYVLASAIGLSIVMAGWVPVPGTVWQVEGSARVAIGAVAVAGWALLLAASFEIDHFALFGLRQVWFALRGQELPAAPFQVRRIYRVVRHPIQTGVLVGMWATPDMTASHLSFAVLMTLYVLVGLYFEERELVAEYGERYREYRRRVAKLVPFSRWP